MAEVFETSYLRGNSIAWLPIQSKDSVLYLGNCEDMAAKKLIEMSNRVDCVDNFEKIAEYGAYDYVISLGEADKKVIACLSGHVKETGKLVVAAENAYGLKYLAGVKDIGSKEYFGAVEALEGSKGYTREELQLAFQTAGFRKICFYYPFPDYQFTMSLYSDDYLPKQGELIDQIGNFDAERLILFDETKAMDAVVARGKFKEFSNSYLVVAGKTEAEPIVNEAGETISYVKFSNDRGKEHNIRTYITKSSDGKRHLLKIADNPQAKNQIANLAKTADVLEKLYENSRLSVNKCQIRSDGAELEFLKGHTMEEELDMLLEQGKCEEAMAKMAQVFEEIRSCKNMQEFKICEAFQEVFGKQQLPEGLMAVPVGDIDMIMPNILVGEDGKWTVIDYEWSFHFPIPVNFILYRAIRYYADTTAARRVLDIERLYAKAKITAQEVSVYAAMEEAFQSYVLNGHVPLRQLYKETGKPAYHISSLMHIKNELEHTRMMQVYFDRGNGTREEDCINFHSKSLDGEFHLEIPVDEDVIAVRIDPAAQACTADIDRLCFASSKANIVEFYGPVHKVSDRIYLFESEDPYLLITDMPEGERKLFVDMRVETMSLAAAELISPKIDLKYRVKKMLKK
ncbi:MAG: hypothetical protein J6A75_08940 [Lachnospiraceae bacterium]|nr:hypothetical protein [Lachnospiraceae bacterium]